MITYLRSMSDEQAISRNLNNHDNPLFESNYK